ncbi:MULTISPECIES: hypothetical protein [Halolamina]|uniref:Uncharacterized protein n=1 Tax=Halolamina pelagica TaxID=699431 RepID=A0A1I5WL97_9EURY|nr:MULTISPECIES: hypothetical protein [Halolamina]SFQ20430.1 hypothetical protein SAMN05216277_1351 [Halolamina pelagica]
MSTPPEQTGVREIPESSRVPPRLDPLPFAVAAATVAAVIMLLLGLFGAIGVYEGGVEMMEQWHSFFTPTPAGTIAGILEAVVITGVFTYLFAELYNRFTGSLS